MRRLAIGILAVLLGAGCAFESVDGSSSRPGEVTPTSADEQLQTVYGPMIHTPPSPAASTAPGPIPHPEPSPWVGPPTVTPNEDDTGQSPEPAPWHESPGALQDTGGAQNGQSGTNSGSSGKSTSAPAGHPPRIGHWDLKDTTASN